MLGQIWNNFLFYPVLNTLLGLYHFFDDNLGWAVIVLAILVRILLIPSTKKQMLMTKTMADLKPKLEELNKKYGNNKELLAKEQIKLYKQSGYNPLGCLFNFIPQMILLIVIIQVIRVVTTESNYEGLYPFVETWINGNAKEFIIDTKFFFWDLGKNYSEIAQEHGYFAKEGMAYIFLSLGVGFVQFVSSKFMQAMQNVEKKKTNKKENKDEPMAPEEMQKQMMKSMTTIFPLLTMYITLTVPSVLGVYWFVQSAMLVVQYYFIDKKKTVDTFKSLNPFKKVESK